jgi:tRNA1Val (adenine37-N6)-methyltransferase
LEVLFLAIVPNIIALPPPFHFKKFTIQQTKAAHPVGTDGVVLGALAALHPNQGSALDIGTGTGLLALMILHNPLILSVTALEPQPESAEMAKKNFDSSPWRPRLTLIQQTLEKWSEQTTTKFNCIVCNPPFFTENVQASNPQREYARHMQHLSPNNLMRAVDNLLERDGYFYLIVPENRSQIYLQAAACCGLYCNSETRLFSRPGKSANRVVLQLGRSSTEYVRKTLTLQTDEGGRTPEFSQLTQDYYL